jgi:hypothetical protein
MKGKNKCGAEVAKGLVVADTHGQEILEALGRLKGHKERGYIPRVAGLESVENNLSDGPNDSRDLAVRKGGSFGLSSHKQTAVQTVMCAAR